MKHILKWWRDLPRHEKNKHGVVTFKIIEKLYENRNN